MRRAFIAIAAAAMVASSSAGHALGFPPTCPGATATVTAISGINSTHARMTAKYTLPDAIGLCNGVSGEAAAGVDPSPADINACIAKFMRENKGAVEWARADCEAGTLTIGEGREGGSFFKFPVDEPSCSSGGLRATQAFRILCPRYRGELEKKLNQ